MAKEYMSLFCEPFEGRGESISKETETLIQSVSLLLMPPVPKATGKVLGVTCSFYRGRAAWVDALRNLGSGLARVSPLLETKVKPQLPGLIQMYTVRLNVVCCYKC